MIEVGSVKPFMSNGCASLYHLPLHSGQPVKLEAGWHVARFPSPAADVNRSEFAPGHQD